jgi:hypothetical protein
MAAPEVVEIQSVDSNIITVSININEISHEANIK